MFRHPARRGRHHRRRRRAGHAGFVPVPEIQFDGFSHPAFDQIVSHLAKYRMRTRGAVNMAVTVRIPSFGGIGAVEHHSESTETYWAHTAGLKVVVPSTPSDAYWLLRHAIAAPDPVIYLEPKRRYWEREAIDLTAPALPIGRAAIRRPGDDVTVVTYGGLVGTALHAAELAARQHGWGIEVVDLRSLNPLDFDTVATSVAKTGRAVVMHEGHARWASAPNWRPGSRKSCSTTWRHRCCARPDSTPPTRRPDWRRCGYRASTG